MTQDKHIFNKCATNMKNTHNETTFDKVLLMENVKPLSMYKACCNICTFNKLKQANVLKKYIIECIYVYIYTEY